MEDVWDVLLLHLFMSIRDVQAYAETASVGFNSNQVEATPESTECQYKPIKQVWSSASCLIDENLPITGYFADMTWHSGCTPLVRKKK